MALSTEASDLEVLYGQTPTPTETPSLIEESMKTFKELLAEEEDEESNWRLAEKRCPDECTDDFKLIFLRCEVYRVELAVKRYIKYWDNRLELFGPDNAFRSILDIGPNGALRDDWKELELGYGRVMPPDKCHDPEGRAIVFLDGIKLDEARDNPGISLEGLARATWYIAHVGLRSESCQRKGFIMIVRPMTTVRSLRKSPAKMVSKSIKGAIPIRVAAIHVLDPPVMVNVFIRIARAFVGKTMQERFHVHNFGSLEKNLESLSEFGIGKKQLPVELGGDFEFEEIDSATDSEYASVTDCK